MKGKRPNIKTSKRPKEARGHDASAVRALDGNEDLDVLTFGRLDVSSSPDFTRRVMGRLGYMQVSKKRARRDRIRRWVNRAGVLVAFAISLGVAQQFYESSNQVRRPNSLTIPAAIGNDVRQQQDRFENVIRSIRSVVPVQPHVVPVSDPLQDNESPRMIDGNFDQPQTSPFRWV